MKEKSGPCPQCGSSRVAGIMYGMPIFNKTLEKNLKEGRVVLGGCCISDNDPQWRCLDCEHEFR